MFKSQPSFYFTFRSPNGRAGKSSSNESMSSAPSTNKLYGSFNKAKPEDLASRFQKKKVKNDDEKALLLNYQDDEHESEDVIHQLSHNANLARAKRSSSKRSSCASSDTESTLSRNSSSSNECLTVSNRNESLERISSSPNKSFLHSQPTSTANSRSGSFSDINGSNHLSAKNNAIPTNNKTDEVIKPRASSIHKSETFPNVSTAKEYEPTRSVVSLYEPNIEITPARRLSLTNLQRSARSSSVDRKEQLARRESPLPPESPPQRRNSALHRHLKKAAEDNSEMSSSHDSGISSSPQPQIIEQNNNQIKDNSHKIDPIVPPTPDTTQSPVTPQTRPVSVLGPKRPTRPAPEPPKPKVEQISAPVVPVIATTPDSVFNAEEEYSKILKQLDADETQKRDSLGVESKSSDDSGSEVSEDDVKNASMASHDEHTPTPVRCV